MKTEMILSETDCSLLGFNSPNQEHQKLFYSIDYKRKTLLGSTSLLSVIRVFQPDLLVAGTIQLAIITLIVRYILNRYPTKGQEKDETALLKYVLDEDAFDGIKGLRSVVLENHLQHLYEIDSILDDEIAKALKSVTYRLNSTKQFVEINKCMENILSFNFDRKRMQDIMAKGRKEKLKVA